LTAYQWIFLPKKATKPTEVADPSERTPLLQGDIQHDVTNTEAIHQEAERTVSAAQDLTIPCLCFAIAATGLILIPFGRDFDEITAAAAFGSLGVPASPSLLALAALASSPSQFGRVFAGFSIIETAVVALQQPLFFGLYRATTSTVPNLIWWLAAALLALSVVIVMSLRPIRFAAKIERAPAGSSNVAT